MDGNADIKFNKLSHHRFVFMITAHTTKYHVIENKLVSNFVLVKMRKYFENFQAKNICF